MTITAVSRWKGNQEETSRIAREIAPILKGHGAVSVRWGPCHAGAYAGQMFAAIVFPDWTTYGSAMHALSEDAAYQRLYAEALKIGELQKRSVIVTQEL